MRTISTIVVVGLLLCLPIIAWSCPGCMRMMDKLEASDQVKAQIQTFCRDHQKAMIPLQDDLRSLRHQMQLLITKDNASSGEVKTLAGKIGTAAEKIATEKAEHMLKIRNLLTPEQRVKFDMFILKGDGKGRGMGMCCEQMSPMPPCPPAPGAPPCTPGPGCPGKMRGGQHENMSE